MRVLHVAAECLPFATTGGLGDVLGALPGAQCAAGCDAGIALPRYGGMAPALRRGTECLRFTCRGQAVTVFEAECTAAGAPVYLFDMPGLFDREGDPYRDPAGRLFPDMEWRFARFCEAVARAVAEHGLFAADVVHGHDWHAGLLPHWLRQLGWRGRCLLSIHNLAFQGWRARADLFDGLDAAARRDGRHDDRGYSMMKAGIVAADSVTTVSPGYAREIQTPALGCGLHLALRARAADGELHGITNGLDPAAWDPRRDPALVRPYGADDVAAGKAASAAALAAELGLVGEGPVVAYVGRLTRQKGADLLAEIGAVLARRHARGVLVGVGDADIGAALARLAAASGGRLVFCARFDATLARRVFAAADLLLVPSRFEPCGLVQMYAQRYGALPVAARVGGLADTIVDAAEPDGSGVLFEPATDDAGTVLAAIERGLRLAGDAGDLARLRRSGMQRSFDWKRVVPRYLALYGARPPAGMPPPPAGMAGIRRGSPIDAPRAPAAAENLS